MLQWLLRNIVGRIAAIPVRRRLRAFEEATNYPREFQVGVLRRILQHQADTDFGKNHHFKDIKTSADFRRHLPIAGYDYLEPYITRVTKGDYNALLADRKVHMFAMTSGTTATRKFIPVTDQYLTDYRRGWNIWGLKVFRDHPGCRLRPIVQMSGDWQEFRTEAGIPCGAVTGLTATMQMRIVRWLYCVPPILGKIKDPAVKYYLALRLSMPRKVGLIIAANPSTLVNLARAGDREKEHLIRDIHDGTLSTHLDVPADIRTALLRKTSRKNPERAKFLEEVVRSTGTLYPKDYWPKDCIIGNWTGGSVGAYLRQYPAYFGATPVRDVGLIASEGRMTIPLSDGTPSGVLDITSHFYEFIPEDEVDSPKPTVLEAHELQEGRTYYILPTTSYGLYRYHIYDVVRCTGYYNKTPLVEFLSKGSLFANLTGEKVSEYHVSGAMRKTLDELNLTLSAYTVAPCWDDQQPYYGLFVEEVEIANRETGQRLIETLERQLSEINVEYSDKRKSGRLGPIRLELLQSGAWQEWDRARLAKTGGSLEQYKRPSLMSDPNFRASVSVSQEWRSTL